MRPYVDEAYAGRGCLAEDTPFRTWASGFNQTRYFTFCYTPIRGAEGEVHGAACICSDTTDKFLATQRSARERDALFALFERTPGFVAITEGPEHVITYSNAAYLAITAGRAAPGVRMVDAVPEVVEQGLITMLDRVYERGEAFKTSEMPVNLLSPDTGELEQQFVSFLYEPMKDEEGAVTGLFLEGYIVTEEKLAKDRIQRLQAELIHLSRASAMDAMASTLAHELNQPLAAIANYVTGSQRLLRRGGSHADLDAPLKAIGENAQRAAGFISSLRDMTKKGVVTHRPVPLLNLIREAVALTQAGYPTPQKVDVNCPPDLLVFADRIQIQQVLINLLRNSYEAVGQDKTSGILISAAAPSGENFITVSVQDDGPGFAPGVLPKLFDAFNSTKEDGMGVGLSISRTIIEAHGGKIWAEHSPEGAAIHFSLLQAS